MHQHLKIFNTLTQLSNNPEMFNSYRLDFYRVRDGDFQSCRSRALNFDPEATVQLILWAQKNIGQREVLAWVPFFQRLDLKDSVLQEFYLKGYIANHLGEILRNRKFKKSELYILANHPVLKDWILHSFVDYGSLKPTGYYGKLVYEINPENIEEETFKKSLILTQYYLEGNVGMMKKWSEALSRYPLDKNYFPIINGRVWAARFMDQLLKTGAIRNDLISDWWRYLKNEPLSCVMPNSMEPLPILVRFGEDTEQIEEILNYIGYAIHVAVVNNPLVASVDNAMYLASQTAYNKRIKDFKKAHEFQNELNKNLCLPSYSKYVFSLANAF